MEKIIKSIIILLLVVILVALGINLYVIISTMKQVTKEDYSKIEKSDCILVLGAAVWGNEPSPMLEDRLKEAIELYKNNVAPKIIVSGDHRVDDYNEVKVMKNYLIEKGIPSDDIFMDHSGLSSYDSIYRAKEVFGVEKMIIVTQRYHLYRALYISNSLGIEAYGVSAEPRQYAGELYREVREILARDKDFVKCIIKPESTYLGEKISIEANGDTTNNK